MSGRTLLEIATGKAPARRGRASFREYAEQVMFADWCDLALAPKDILYTATMTGINLPPKVAKQAKRKGVRKGAPDFLIFARATGDRDGGMAGPRYVGLALEFKDPEGDGRTSADQLRWAEGLRAEGWMVEQPTTFLEAKGIACQYLRIRG